VDHFHGGTVFGRYGIQVVGYADDSLIVLVSEVIGVGKRSMSKDADSRQKCQYGNGKGINTFYRHGCVQGLDLLQMFKIQNNKLFTENEYTHWCVPVNQIHFMRKVLKGRIPSASSGTP
jgi:hypothetical protein